ncbi:hypothetical protein [Chryseobacterium indoltheticum]|uniref:Uncharacterized protein n=1 Tax=Chryseobacterium indoltheticum TaxID=254 RepID=A0A381F8Q1_9FLAO|nr:hypothetical protein [Chryseobacterium indoltheticum]SUX42824.1 Uncharacterised protein [Chryseobacterium indoltheticum]
MKKIFTVCSILSGLLFFAQEAGKAGELLKNEVSKEKLNLQPPKGKIHETIIQIILQDSEIQIIRIIQTKNLQTQIINGIITTDMRKFS